MRFPRILRAWLLGLAALGAAVPVAAGQTPAFDGPPAPVPPAVLARDADGRVTVRAVRLTQPLRLDGQLDEALYRDVPAMSGYIQMEPVNGAPATERTETWLAFDDDNVYVSFRNWDTQMERLVATEMRRDSNVMFQGNDVVLFLFDTFYDRRNSVLFTINPLAGRQDGQVTNERLYNPDWNPVWDVKTGRFDGGWTVEAAVPFKSLKYTAGVDQLWGFNAMRIKRSKNEISALTALPSYRGAAGLQIASLAATAVGLQAPQGGRSLDVKPYITSNASTDRTLTTPVEPDHVAYGVDVKYGVTQNLTADLTYKTDFAQVEADEQQINLTRFTLFFPEKRDFFLENQGTFSFGGVPLQGTNAATSAAPILFYSRRIGLNQGREVPLEVGGRITGRMGPYSVGVVGIRTGDERTRGTPATTFSVVRVKRDILRRSSVGLIYTGRSVSPLGGQRSAAYGADGTFSFFDGLFVNAFWARTDTDDAPTPGGRAPNGRASYRAQLDYNGDRYGLQLERVGVGAAFRPDVGLVRRADIARDFALARFSPRPKRQGAVRKYFAQASMEYIENTAGVLESRDRSTELALEFQNADRVSVGYTNSFEALQAPFAIGGDVTLPVGAYRFDTLRAGYNMGQQRALSANITLEHGSFYNGRKTSLGIARGRALVTSQLAVEPTYSLNRVRLTQGDFTTHLLGTRLTYTMTPLMFASALVQYNSGTNSVSTNARFRWEYRPGSEIFVVYNEERNTRVTGFPYLSTRSFIVKANTLLRF
jgi:hypothetical protein